MCASSNEPTKGLGVYMPLAMAAGIGSLLGSGVIVGLSSTITVWQTGMGLDNGQVGIVSGILTFAIAFGSFFGGRLADTIGRVRVFNWINLVYAIGAVACALAPNFVALTLGVAVVGVASGADLPVSMTVVSHDAPSDSIAARLVSTTQIFWQLGILIASLFAFGLSRMQGDMGGRVVFAVLAVLALVAWLWRLLSPSFRSFHEAAEKRDAEQAGTESAAAQKVSVIKVLFGPRRQVLLQYLATIMVFYLGWNLLANTWGQFQTFMFVKANASQSLATGLGVALNVMTVIVSMIFASIAGGKYRNKAFVVGMIFSFIAMLCMALGGTNLWVIVGATAIQNIGTPLAGEALYKVWTQESFPIEIRSSIQGFINGTSRLVCALFAFVTPLLVLPGTIRTTMWCFLLVIVIEFIAGCLMISFQHRYGTDEEYMAATHEHGEA